MLSVSKVTPWGLRIQVGERTSFLPGEMNTSPDSGEYVIYSDIPIKWDPPFESDPIEDEARKGFIQAAVQRLAELGWKPVVS